MAEKDKSPFVNPGVDVVESLRYMMGERATCRSRWGASASGCTTFAPFPGARFARRS